MILDRIANGEKYSALSERFARAFELLSQGDIAYKEDGRYEVDGKNLYFMVQNYATKPAEERRFESHRKYADIQAVYSGREAMGYKASDGLKVQEPYNDEKDIMFDATPESYTNLHIETGEFVVLFPEEAHMPQVQLDGPAQVRKVVFKVLIEN